MLIPYVSMREYHISNYVDKRFFKTYNRHMGRKTKLKNKQQDLTVHLKPVFGIKPGQYLAVLYSLILLLILSIVFIIPGIKKFGSEVTVNTTPEGTSVYADGKWLGTTPLIHFVPKGDIEFEFRKENFTTVNVKYEVKGRLFGSMIFPEKLSITENLIIADINKLTDDAYKDHAGWSLTGDPSLRYQKPPILTETVKSVFHRKEDASEVEIDRIKLFLEDSMKNVSSPSMLRDLLNGSAIKSSGGYLPGPSSVIRLINELSNQLDNNPRSILWLLENSGDSLSKNLNSQEWVKKNISQVNNQIENFTIVLAEKNDYISLSGINYAGFSKGQYISGDIKIIHTSPFYMQTTEVTNKQYYEFIKENEYWRPLNIKKLISDGLAAEDYLKTWKNEIYRPEEKDFPVSYISREAAKAYSKWLTKLLYGDFEGWIVKLPSETEWEMAALADITPDYKQNILKRVISVNNLTSGNAGLYGMNGNLWEWTDDDYSLYSHYFNDNGTEHKKTGTAVVKGGSWANTPGEVGIYTRGSQPSYWCTPYIGFRTILIKKAIRKN